MDLVTVAAFALLALGVIGSVAPLLPGALLSLSGVYLYWWHAGYAEPGLFALAAFTVVGLTALVADYFGGAIAAGAGGASTRTVAVAAVAGIVLFFLAGPLGTLLGVAATVFALEVYRLGDLRRGTKATLFAVLGMLGSALVQVLLTGAMLAGFGLLVVL